MKSGYHVIVSAILALSGLALPAGASDSVFKEYVGAELFNKAGEKQALSSLDGKYVGLYFSASWCGPCRKFTPELQAFHKKFNGNFEVVLVGSDQNDKKHYGYMKKYNMDWLTIPLNGKVSKALDKRFQVRGIPTLVLIDPQGKVITTRGRDVVYQTKAVLDKPGNKMMAKTQEYNCGSCSKTHTRVVVDAVN